MNILICPRTLFEELFVNLLANPETPAWLLAGSRTTATDREWFVRAVRTVLPHDQSHYQVSLVSEPPTGTERGRLSDRTAGCLWLGNGGYRSKVWGEVYGQDAAEPLDRLFLPGPGMFTIEVTEPPMNRVVRPAAAEIANRFVRTLPPVFDLFFRESRRQFRMNR